MSFRLDDLKKPSDITCTKDVFAEADRQVSRSQSFSRNPESLRERIHAIEELSPQVRRAALGIIEAAEMLGCSPALSAVLPMALKSDDFRMRGMAERVIQILEGDQGTFYREHEVARRTALQFMHVLNNRMSVILSNVPFIRDGIEDGIADPNEQFQLKDALEDILGSAREITGLTGQLMQVSDSALYIRFPVDVATSVQDIINRNESSITVGYDGPDHLKGWFVGHQITNALKELLKNAAEAATGRRAYVRLEDTSLDENEACRYGLDPGRYVKLSVRDYGCGMKEEVKLSALKPFYTTRASVARLGLGLTIAAAAAYNHNGTIQIDTATGENSGTTVTLFLKHSPPEEESSDS